MAAFRTVDAAAAARQFLHAPAHRHRPGRLADGAESDPARHRAVAVRALAKVLHDGGPRACRRALTQNGLLEALSRVLDDGDNNSRSNAARAVGCIFRAVPAVAAGVMGGCGMPLTGDAAGAPPQRTVHGAVLRGKGGDGVATTTTGRRDHGGSSDVPVGGDGGSGMTVGAAMLPGLVRLLRGGHDIGRSRAAWALESLVVADTVFARLAVNRGVEKYLVAFWVEERGEQVHAGDGSMPERSSAEGALEAMFRVSPDEVRRAVVGAMGSDHVISWVHAGFKVRSGDGDWEGGGFESQARGRADDADMGELDLDLDSEPGVPVVGDTSGTSTEVVVSAVSKVDIELGFDRVAEAAAAVGASETTSIDDIRVALRNANHALQVAEEARSKALVDPSKRKLLNDLERDLEPLKAAARHQATVLARRRCIARIESHVHCNEYFHLLQVGANGMLVACRAIHSRLVSDRRAHRTADVGSAVRWLGEQAAVVPFAKAITSALSVAMQVAQSRKRKLQVRAAAELFASTTESDSVVQQVALKLALSQEDMLRGLPEATSSHAGIFRRSMHAFKRAKDWAAVTRTHTPVYAVVEDHLRRLVGSVMSGAVSRLLSASLEEQLYEAILGRGSWAAHDSVLEAIRDVDAEGGSASMVHPLEVATATAGGAGDPDAVAVDEASHIGARVAALEAGVAEAHASATRAEHRAQRAALDAAVAKEARSSPRASTVSASGLVADGGFGGDVEAAEARRELGTLRAAVVRQERQIGGLECATGAVSAAVTEGREAHVARAAFMEAHFEFEVALLAIRQLADKKFGKNGHKLKRRGDLFHKVMVNPSVNLAKQLRGARAKDPATTSGANMWAVVRQNNLGDAITWEELRSHTESMLKAEPKEEP